MDVADFLPPGATWLPAPQHTLPTLPGQPPMIGYLVLVPADQQTVLPVAVPDQPEASDLTAGDGPLIRVDTVQRTAEVDGQPLDLTYLEFELLAHLVAHPHRVHTRDQLVTTVWGYGHVGDGRTVDVHIARLRRKLGADHRQTIQTVRRVGYKYTPPTGR
ncbi:transcriptional regulator [Streptomyces avermitilis]|uniref:Transcriptional regulator n=1 Tax=Streptomyces avermitilis TaxID=33903 RepID=A0A4D4M302_STRAX|nr:transcriptional regulator [Streptomyces avermitilis]GDY73571.1 transcriptional regulator [Streptomyces avermitilis]